MPQPVTFNPKQTRTFDAAVHAVKVELGDLTVSKGSEVASVGAGETHEAGDEASLTFYSPDGALATFTFTDEVEAAPVPRPRKIKKGRK